MAVRGERSSGPGRVVYRSLSAMGAVWSALLVGGGLAGALILWLLRGDPGTPGKDGGAVPQKDAPPGEAASPGGGGGGGLSPEPSERELVSKAGIPSPGLRSDVPGVLKFIREGEMKATGSCPGGPGASRTPD